MERTVDYNRYTRDAAFDTAKRFKALYPTVEFKVFATENAEVYFVVEDPYFTRNEVVQRFEHSIKPMALFIRLTDKAPANSIEIRTDDLLENTDDLKISHTLSTLEETLCLRHPSLSIIGLTQKDDLSLTIILPTIKRNADLDHLNRDIEQLGWKKGGITIDFKDPDVAARTPKSAFPTDVFSVARRDARPEAVRKLKHVIEDDEKWYHVFSQAARGELSQQIFSVDDASLKKVFLPAAEWSTLPDLRNYFLLYDQVILEAPLAEQFVNRHDRILTQDYAEAAARGRLKVLITQPEERLTLRLLEEIQERNPSSIIGRRASVVYAMQNIANKRKSFEAKTADLKSELINAARIVSEVYSLDRDTAERLLSTPVADFYDAASKLRRTDLKGLPSQRGEDIWALVSSILRSKGLPDLALEFRIASTMTSMGALFGAEVALGQVRSPLSFPAHMTTVISSLFDPDSDTQRAFSTNESKLAILPEGPIFSFSRSRRLSELLDIVRSQDAEIARSIMSDLASLSDEERPDRIIEINNIVHHYGGVPSEKIIGKGMPARYGNLIVQAIALFVAPLGLLLGFLQTADGAAAFFRDAGRLKALGEDVRKSRRQVELLVRSRKVAWLDER